jgi:pyruvate dehydrogenase E2 component (dihydrolipoamide acetyltransferase)
MSEPIVPIVMPKWGLSMTDGVIVRWLVSEGATIALGDEIAEIDTDKIDGDLEATGSGVLRRIVAPGGSRFPVGALLAVVADASVSDPDIDAFIGGFPEPAEVDEGAGEAASPYETIEVGGLRMRASKLGQGPPIVLIHGFGGDLDNWLFNLAALAEHGTVVAMDLPGHGESSLAIPDPSPAGMGEVVWSVLDALGVIEPATLVGHSMGGAIAAQMATDRPDRVRSLALISAAGLGTEINQGYIDGFVAARSKREMRDAAGLLFVAAEAVSRSMVDAMLRYKRIDGVIPLLETLRDAWFVDGSQRHVIVETLQALGKPVLIVWGADDRVIPADHATAGDGFAAVHIIDGAGHMVQMEKANDVNRLLTAHVTEGIPA